MPGNEKQPWIAEATSGLTESVRNGYLPQDTHAAVAIFANQRRHQELFCVIERILIRRGVCPDTSGGYPPMCLQTTSPGWALRTIKRMLAVIHDGNTEADFAAKIAGAPPACQHL